MSHLARFPRIKLIKLKIVLRLTIISNLFFCYFYSSAEKACGRIVGAPLALPLPSLHCTIVRGRGGLPLKAKLSLGGCDPHDQVEGILTEGHSNLLHTQNFGVKDMN